jgi:hypothetical protein
MEYLKLLLPIILAYSINFLAPITPFFIIIMALVFSDLYTGISAAKKEGTYKKLEASKGLRTTITKITQYFIAILLSRGMVVAFEINPVYLPLTYIIAFYIAFVELKSNFENISRTTGIDLWQIIGSRLKSLIPPKK